MPTIKIVKVSEKGQIAIPLVVRESAGIKYGDELLLVEKEGKILIEKSSDIQEKVDDDFKDILKFSEQSLKEVWDNTEDDIWSSYLEK